MRENGERQSLSYDEVLFLMKDSVRLYMEYDEIVLTNAGEMGMFIFPEDEQDVKISAYHGDFSADTVEKSHELFDKVIYDIYDIFAYRCFVYDTWLESRIEGIYSGSGVNRNTSIYLESEKALYEPVIGFLTGATPVLLKFYNEFEFASYEEYTDAINVFSLYHLGTIRKFNGCVQPCLMFVPGGIRIYYQNLAIETFTIEELLDVPEDVRSGADKRKCHQEFHKRYRLFVYRDTKDEWISARNLSHVRDLFAF
jgi:hypothetical protein